MRIANYWKVAIAIICLIGVWTFYIEGGFIKYYEAYFASEETITKVKVISCNQTQDGPFLAPETPKINRERVVDVLSYNDTKLKLAYADLTWHICIMVKDQAPDIAEWIEMQYLMGATHISIYDHGSTDNLTDIINIYMNETWRAADPYFPPIELIRWPPKDHTEDVLTAFRQYAYEPDEQRDTVTKIAICKAGIGLQATHASGHCQQAMIADCATRFRLKRDWLSWHDVDEFFWVTADKSTSPLPTVSTHLKAESPKMLSPYMSSFTFGTNGYQNRGEYAGKLVVEAHTQRAPFDQLDEGEQKIKDSIPACSGTDLCQKGGGKSISRGIGSTWHTTEAGSPHYLDKSVNVTYVQYPLRMNHYQMKSVEEADVGSRKQNKDWNVKAARLAGNFWNAVFDDGLAKFSPEIRKRLKERGLL